jgi:AMP nucleosidase
MPYLPPFIAPSRHSDPHSALAQVRAIYSQQINHLRDAMQRFVAGEALSGHVRACYPFVRIHTDTVARQNALENSGLSYGFVANAGRFETTLTRPDLYGNYYLEQFRLLRFRLPRTTTSKAR